MKKDESVLIGIAVIVLIAVALYQTGILSFIPVSGGSGCIGKGWVIQEWVNPAELAKSPICIANPYAQLMVFTNIVMTQPNGQTVSTSGDPVTTTCNVGVLLSTYTFTPTQVGTHVYNAVIKDQLGNVLGTDTVNVQIKDTSDPSCGGCTEGARRCRNTQTPETCINGAWQYDPYDVCISPATCSNGVCSGGCSVGQVVCDPENSPYYKQCVANGGGSWTTTKTCAGLYAVCKNGACGIPSGCNYFNPPCPTGQYCDQPTNTCKVAGQGQGCAYNNPACPTGRLCNTTTNSCYAPSQPPPTLAGIPDWLIGALVVLIGIGIVLYALKQKR